MRREFSNLAGRIGLTVMCTLGMTAIILLVFRLGPEAPHSVLKWLAVVWIGLVAGVSTYLLLSKGSLILRLVTALLAAISSLWLLAWLAPASIGVGLFAGTSSSPNLDSLFQLLLGSVVASMSLLILPSLFPRRKSRRRRSVRRASPIHSKKASSKGRSSTHDQKPAASQEQVRQTTGSASVPASTNRGQTGATNRVQPGTEKRAEPGVTRSRPAIFDRFVWNDRWMKLRNRIEETWTDLESMRWPESIGSPTYAAKQRVKLQKSTLKINNKRPTGSPVRLREEVEHRCPYCLELVEENDTRGMKECPVCHTRHHADCWAVTGVCQVPHFHT